MFKLSEMDIFNFIRGIALLCAIGIHAVYIVIVYNKYPAPASPLLHTPAWIAMWIFFFLSGYLLGKGFYKNKYKTNTSGILNFYKSRFIRIMPLYFICLFTIILYMKPLLPFQHPDTIIRLITFTFQGKAYNTPQIGQLWFVSVIVQCYILAPFVYKYFLSKIKDNTLFFLTIIIAFGLTYRLCIYNFNLNYWKYSMTFCISNFDLFFGGMLLNALTQNSKFILSSIVQNSIKCLSLSAFFLIIITHLFLQNENTFIYRYLYPTIVFLILACIVLAFDCPANKECKTTPVTLKRIIKNPLRFIEYLGIISYPFYLYNMAVLIIVFDTIKNPEFLIYIYIKDEILSNTVFFSSFIITFIIAAAAHYLVEKRLNEYRKKYK